VRECRHGEYQTPVPRYQPTLDSEDLSDFPLATTNPPCQNWGARGLFKCRWILFKHPLSIPNKIYEVLLILDKRVDNENLSYPLKNRDRLDRYSDFLFQPLVISRLI
jgi:hypothetical protein